MVKSTGILTRFWPCLLDKLGLVRKAHLAAGLLDTPGAANSGSSGALPRNAGSTDSNLSHTCSSRRFSSCQSSQRSPSFRLQNLSPSSASPTVATMACDDGLRSSGTNSAPSKNPVLAHQCAASRASAVLSIPPEACSAQRLSGGEPAHRRGKKRPTSVISALPSDVVSRLGRPPCGVDSPQWHRDRQGREIPPRAPTASARHQGPPATVQRSPRLFVLVPGPH